VAQIDANNTQLSEATAADASALKGRAPRWPRPLLPLAAACNHLATAYH